jgi:hypothetical protein
MEAYDLKIGTKIEFSLVTGSAGLKGATYISQLLDIVDAENIIISTPITNSRIVFIPPGFNIKITLLDPKHGLLGFTGQVLKRDIRGNINILHVKVVSALEKIQRRQYFRLDNLMNAEYRLFTGDAAVIANGMVILHFLLPTYFTYVCTEIFSGTLRGMGDSLVPMLIICSGLILFRGVCISKKSFLLIAASIGRCC